MSISNISTASKVSILTGQLQAQNSALSDLANQLASQKKHTDLTDYTPSEALTLLNLQSSSTQKSAYINVINTAQTRLSAYDTTMTDMESITSQAEKLVAGSGNYSAANASTVSTLATNFLKSIGIDLNQEINGRYIYAGARYGTQPVSNLDSLSGTPSTAIYTDGKTVPDYDSSATTSTLTSSISGQNVTIGGTASATQSSSVVVNGKTYTYDATASDTPTTVAAGLSSLIAVDIPGTTSSGAVLTVGATGTIASASGGTTNSAAYTVDSATIDTGYNLTLGVTSNNTAFQQLIAGLRYMQQAGSATNDTTYKAAMTQASNLLTSAASSLQAIHSAVANNINTLTSEKKTQTAAITSLADQVANIQQVDVTQVAAQITALQTLLQASYSVTGTIEKMSIVSYL